MSSYPCSDCEQVYQSIKAAMTCRCEDAEHDGYERSDP